VHSLVCFPVQSLFDGPLRTCQCQILRIACTAIAMVSLKHEGLIKLVRDRPAFAGDCSVGCSPSRCRRSLGPAESGSGGSALLRVPRHPAVYRWRHSDSNVFGGATLLRVPGTLDFPASRSKPRQVIGHLVRLFACLDSR
jgi:hypothetical protein